MTVYKILCISLIFSVKSLLDIPWHFDTPICWMIFSLFYPHFALTVWQLLENGVFACNSLSNPHFDSRWHFDSWHWKNMGISIKTTYLLAFSALSYRLQLSNCQNRFFWHLTLSRLTLAAIRSIFTFYPHFALTVWQLLENGVSACNLLSNPHFDNRWHFDSWHWNNMGIFEKTTYLLVFSALSYRL